MSEIIKNRISALREYLKSKNIQAFIIPSSDSHLSEYPADHWKSREWISGFTGSAGTMVVTQSEAGLWTDSRYFLQAESELQGSGITLFKEGLSETPSIPEYLSKVLKSGDTVGIDGNVYSAKNALQLEQILAQNGIKLDAQFDPFESVWADRPSIPTHPVFELPVEIAGVTTLEKIDQINTQLERLGANGLLISSLDTVAWLFNLRGNDVEYNPVFVSYAYVSPKETVLFLDPRKLDTDLASHLQKQGIILAQYDKISDYVGSLQGLKICVQGDKTSYSLYRKAITNNQLVDVVSPADLLKSQKNQFEIEGFRRAMLKDAVALTRFFMWLEKAVPEGNVTEHLISEKLVEFRSEQPRFVGESFGTIAGFQENGAIVHYHADTVHSKKVVNEGFLLVDSGGQYFDGTTDITRTVAMGNLSQQMKEDYTNVLKGHIAVATAIFPDGTKGAQLDTFARQYLWKSGANYLHGTGHGVGHFLNVHEGPQSIRTDENPTILKPGMVISNEPGVYRAGKYGIRIENLIAVTPAFDTELGKFYQFETLTLFPIDTTPIMSEMLSTNEIAWLNNYHQQVFELVSPLLKDEESVWLKEKTQKIELK